MNCFNFLKQCYLTFACCNNKTNVSRFSNRLEVNESANTISKTEKDIISPGVMENQSPVGKARIADIYSIGAHHERKPVIRSTIRNDQSILKPKAENSVGQKKVNRRHSITVFGTKNHTCQQLRKRAFSLSCPPANQVTENKNVRFSEKVTIYHYHVERLKTELELFMEKYSNLPPGAWRNI